MTAKPLHHRTLLLLAAIGVHGMAQAQVLCVTCVDQNTPITTGLTNLLLNGGFESTACPPAAGSIGAATSFCPNSSGYVCDIDDWLCTGGGPDTYACIQNSFYTQLVEGNYAVYFGNHYCNACSSVVGDTLCLVDEGCEVTGIPAGYPTNEVDYGNNTGISLEQTVNGLTVGGIYALEFWAGGEYQGEERGLFAVDVGFGKIYLRCWYTEGGAAHAGTRYTIFFMATSPAHTIRFTNWGHITWAAPELILDDVKLYHTSEGPQGPCTVGIKTPPVEQDTHLAWVPEGWRVSTPRAEEQDLRVYDITGRTLLQWKFTGATTIPADRLPPGAHVCTVHDQGGRVWSTVLVGER